LHFCFLPRNLMGQVNIESWKEKKPVKKRMSKRFLSMLLAVVMVVSMLPMSVFAAGASDAVDNVLDGFDFDVKGVGVNVDFGGTVDPNSLLADEYDIKAAGAIMLNYDSAIKNMVASGEVELYIPFSLFEDTINEMIESKTTSYAADVQKVYSDLVDSIEDTPVTYTDSVVVVSGYPAVDISISGTPAEIVTKLFTETVDVNGTDYYYYELYGTKADAAAKIVSFIEEKAGIAFATTAAAGQALTNWKTDIVADGADIGDLVGRLIAAACLKKVQSIASDPSDNRIPSEVATKLASVQVHETVTVNNKNRRVFSTKSTIATALYEKVTDYISGIVGPLVSVDEDGTLLNRIYYEFYGELDPTYEWETLTGRFDTLLGEEDGCIIYDFVNSLPAALSGSVDFDSLTSMFPTETISSLETMLKETVASINDTLENGVGAGVINGAILGCEDTDELTPRNTTGIYIVAGVNSANTEDMTYRAYVLAPEIVPVTITADGSDKGALLKTTVGETCTINSSVGEGFDAAHLMQLRIDGMTTSGEYYNDSGDDGVAAPADAGVYTVMSISLDESTLAMGGDIAVLVVEPADTPTDAFKFTEKETEVPYDGDGHYPGLTNTMDHIAIKGAVGPDKADPDNKTGAYVILDGATIVGGVEELESSAEAIINGLNNKAQGLHLPIGGLTNHAMEALEKLANFAKEKGAKVDDGASLDAAEVKAYLSRYLTALEDWYSYDNVKGMASRVYTKAKDTITNSGVDETVKKYQDMIDAVMTKFESFGGAATYNMRAASTESTASKFMNVFLEKSGITKDNVAATVESVLNYAVEVATENGGKYLDDAMTLVNTVGALSGASKADAETAAANVMGYYDEMVAAVKTDVKSYLGINSLDGLSVAVLESKIKDLVDRDFDEAKALVKAVLKDVETFVKATVDEAKAFVTGTNWAVDVVYFNVEPTEVGVYDCYAVNANPNYVPNLTQATLEIVQRVTITVEDQTIPVGGSIDGSKYTLTDTVTGETITAPGLTVTLKVVDGTDVNTAGVRTDAIEAAYTIAEGYNYDVTVADKNDADDNALANLTVEEKYKWGQNIQVGLIEPWFMRANAKVTEIATNTVLDYGTLADYGVYFVRARYLDDPDIAQEDLTVEAILNNPNTKLISKGTGDDDAFHEGTDANAGYFSARYNDGIYTYELNESIYVLAYITEADGDTYYAPVRERNLLAEVTKRKDQPSSQPTEIPVFAAMHDLYYSTVARRNGADLTPIEFKAELNDGTISAVANTGYTFSHNQQVLLIEPWGIRFNCQVKENGSVIDYSTVQDYGAVIFYDTENTVGGTVTLEELLANQNAYVMSKTNGGAFVDTVPGKTGNYIGVYYNKEVYTYQMQSNAYIAFFVKDADGYHFGDVKVRNIMNVMETGAANGVATEVAVVEDMKALNTAIIAHRNAVFGE